jgi:RES domain-containing protein
VSVRLWRVSRHVDLSGAGGLSASARWHARGRRVVYGAESPALAVLEVLVHLEIDASDHPRGYHLVEIHAPDDVMDVDLRALRKTWQIREFDTRALGDAWLAAGETLLLRVPSAVVPGSWNYLINPGHPRMRRVRIVATTPDPFDRRLLSARPRSSRRRR